MTTAAEHFDWAVGRAMEYADLDDPANAMASLVSDLGKHAGTARILTPDLHRLFMGEVVIDGARGARRFIEGLPRPAGRRVAHADADAFDDVPPNAGSAS